MPGKVTYKNTNGESQFEPDAINEEKTNALRGSDINFFEAAQVIINKKKLVGGITLAITLIVAAYLFYLPNLYMSTATILPSGKSGNNMSALTSLVGLGNITSLSDENSSSLFPLILRANLVVDEVLGKEYTFTHESKQMTLTLPDYFAQTNRDKLRKLLRSITTINMSQKMGEISIGVETKYPALSQAVLAEYIGRLEEFNLYKRKTSAGENEKYLARQIEKTNLELRDAENKLEAYQLANQNWAMTDSPEILKELGQMKRNAEVKAGIYLTLCQQYEMAKLDAQKDVPIVSILDSPSLPTQKSGPFRSIFILISGALSFLLVSLGLMIGRVIQKSAKYRNQNDYDDFQREIKSAFPRTNRIIDNVKKSRKRKTMETV